MDKAMGKSQRTKGHSWERAVAAILRPYAENPEGIRRGLQARGGGRESADVEHPRFHIECKAGKMPNLRSALRQAIEDNADRGKLPVAIIKDDRGLKMAVMRLEDWINAVHSVAPLEKEDTETEGTEV